MKRRHRWALILGGFVALLVLASAIPGARRRVELVWLRAIGAIPDVTWGDVIRMLPPRSGYDVAALLKNRNPYATIENPFVQTFDVAAGEESFRARCALCHGRDAQGGTGPDLTKGQFRHGASDWALFRTITRGIRGTAMQGHALPSRGAWQLVAYVRSVGRASHSDRNGPVHEEGPGVTPPEVTFERLKDASRDSANWLTYSGTLDGQRHSRLSQINRSNVSQLKIKWLFQLATSDNLVETSPLVVGTTMYLTSPPSDVWALDTRTGAPLWSYTRPMPDNLKLCCARANRGLAVLGNTLYLGTLDAHLVALDAMTGSAQWEVELADYRDGYSITGAPLALDGRVIVGVAGGEFGIRGFLDAYDAQTGRRLWRFYTVPGPGEKGHETWGGDSWMTGGAPTWMTGTYDADSNLLYWGVGNPGPDYQGDVRPGDNLYSNCVVALEVETGRLRWYYQFTPHDEHDRDATEILVLADAVLDGRPRKLILQANRNGFYYVLDRETGAFLIARAFVQQTWVDGFDSAGRPMVRPGSSPTSQGRIVYPGDGGGTNWWSPSYDAEAKLFYVPALERAGIFFKTRDPVRIDGSYEGSAGQTPRDQPYFTVVRALSATTGELRWEFRPPAALMDHAMGGLLSTAGGLVFAGSKTAFFALDAKTGAELWRMNTGGKILAAPITYLRDGRQQVTVAAGRTIVTFSLDGR